MKLKNVFIGIIGIATLEACSDFLEEQSQDEVIVRTVTDYSQFLLGSAYDMRNSGEILYLLDDDVALEENSIMEETMPMRLTISDISLGSRICGSVGTRLPMHMSAFTVS